MLWCSTMLEINKKWTSDGWRGWRRDERLLLRLKQLIYIVMIWYEYESEWMSRRGDRLFSFFFVCVQKWHVNRVLVCVWWRGVVTYVSTAFFHRYNIRNKMIIHTVNIHHSSWHTHTHSTATALILTKYTHNSVVLDQYSLIQCIHHHTCMHTVYTCIYMCRTSVVCTCSTLDGKQCRNETNNMGQK